MKGWHYCLFVGLLWLGFVALTLTQGWSIGVPQ